MKRLLAALAVVLTVAFAASLGSLYDQVSSSMARALALQADNPSQALRVIAGAEDTFRKGSAGLPPQLVSGILQALADAKQALSRKSSADLEARGIVIKSIFGKALYDAYFSALSAGNATEAASLLPRLVKSAGFSNSVQSQASTLSSAGNIGRVRNLFEQSYARGISSALRQAQAETSPTRAYLAVTRAYGLFLAVQDSPRAGRLDASMFINALVKLSARDQAGFQQDVRLLLQNAGQFLKNTETQSASANNEKIAPPKPAPAAAKEAAKAPAPKPVPATPLPKTQEELSSPKPIAAPVSSSPERGQAGVQVGTVRGVNPELAKRIAPVLSKLGFESANQWLGALNEVRVEVARALALVQAGHQEESRTYLKDAQTVYEKEVAPVVSVLDPVLAKRMGALIKQMESALGIRTSDLAVLLGEIQEIEERLTGKTLGTRHAFEALLERYILGIPRAFLFLLGGVLAFLPLYLLWLTFGGRNIYWRYLSLSFVFLLLPAILEGVSFLGSILAERGGLPTLNALSGLSIAQSLTAQLVWAISIFLAVAFAAAGLRGIATQFGILRDRRVDASQETVEKTSQGAAAAQASSVRATSQRLPDTEADWDEEF